MPKGRPFGSKSKDSTAIRKQMKLNELLDHVFDNYNGLGRMLMRLLDSEDETIRMYVTMKLMEFRYGKPKQQIVGEDGGAIVVNIVSNIRRPDRLLDAHTEPDYIQTI